MRARDLLGFGIGSYAKSALRVAEQHGVSGAVRDVLERAAAGEIIDQDTIDEVADPEAWDEAFDREEHCKRILEPFVSEFGDRVEEEERRPA